MYYPFFYCQETLINEVMACYCVIGFFSYVDLRGSGNWL